MSFLSLLCWTIEKQFLSKNDRKRGSQFEYAHFFSSQKILWNGTSSRQAKRKTHRNIENDIMISFGLRWLNRKEITEISELMETFQSDYIR